MPFAAVVIDGIPRLATLDQSNVSAIEDDTEAHAAILCHIVYDGEVVLIPNLDTVESMIRGALS